MKKNEKYEKKVWEAVLKANKAIAGIADEFAINSDDLKVGLEVYWQNDRENNFELALIKMLSLLEDKKGDVSDKEMQTVADEFGVDVDEIMEKIVEVMDELKSEKL